MTLLDEVRKLPHGKKDLRTFGLTLGVFFLILTGVFFALKRVWVPYFWIPGAVLTPWALVWPQSLRPLQLGWMTAAFLIGWVMTRVILSVVFFGVIWPISLVARARGKRFLETRFPAPEASLWVDHEPRASSGKKPCENQY